MEYKELLELIRTVSDSNIVDFKYEQGDTKIVMSSGEVQAKPTKTVVVSEEIVVPAKTETPVPKGNIVKSPLVGTFYAAPAEGADPFVKVGDMVKKGQTLAFVEAMKLMNEIESDFDGVISEIFVENGNMVEYGQPLFSII